MGDADGVLDAPAAVRGGAGERERERELKLKHERSMANMRALNAHIKAGWDEEERKDRRETIAWLVGISVALAADFAVAASLHWIR